RPDGLGIGIQPREIEIDATIEVIEATIGPRAHRANRHSEGPGSARVTLLGFGAVPSAPPQSTAPTLVGKARGQFLPQDPDFIADRMNISTEVRDAVSCRAHEVIDSLIRPALARLQHNVGGTVLETALTLDSLSRRANPVEEIE